MTQLNLSGLESLANLDFETFKALYLGGTNRAEQYYSVLAYEAGNANLVNVVAYAARSEEIATNSGVRGFMENSFAKTVAAEASIDLTVGADAWLRVQYDKMQADYDAREERILNGGTGELSNAQTLQVMQASYGNIALTPKASIAYLPLYHLEQADPAMAQARFLDYNSGDSGFLSMLDDSLALAFGAKINPQNLSEALSLWSEQAHWINTMLDAYEELILAVSPVPQGLQDSMDMLQQLSDLAGDALDLLSDWVDGIEGGLSALADWITENVLSKTGMAPEQSSPLVLDLDNDGIELTALNGAGSVYWDLDQDGMAEASGWVAPDDGLLALDWNEDGIITDHTELFGTKTLDGFIALAALDSDDNNIMNASDEDFARLLVWKDTNADGYSQQGELYTLAQLNITSINLGYSTVNITNNGNTITSQSTFTMNGNSRTIVDAWFSYDDVNTTYAGDYTLDVRTLFLPTLRGYGDIADLHIAMSRDETLLDLVTDLATKDMAALLAPAYDLDTKIKDIMYRWSGVDGESPTGRGAYIDGRSLAFLEALTAEPFNQRGSERCVQRCVQCRARARSGAIGGRADI